MAFLATYIILHVSVAYLVHPCEWSKKEGWRKRQMKKMHGFYKKTRSGLKDVSRIIRGIPVSSLFSWQIWRSEDDEIHDSEMKETSQEDA